MYLNFKSYAIPFQIMSVTYKKYEKERNVNHSRLTLNTPHEPRAVNNETYLVVE